MFGEKASRFRGPAAIGSVVEKADNLSLRQSPQLAWLVLSALSALVLMTAFALTPSPDGHGTHTQLGLPPCGFFVITGLPCPGCGLTTSFAHLARLNLLGAVRANIWGVPLFVGVVLSACVGPVLAYRARPVGETLVRYRLDTVAAFIVVFGFAAWAVRVMVVVLR